MKKNEISKTLEKVFETIKEVSNNINDLQLCFLACNVLRYARRISKGLMTESEAMGFLTKSAKGIIVTDSIYLVSSILLWAVEEYQKSEKRRADKASTNEDHMDVDDLDDETESPEEPVVESDPTVEPA
jgi:hypothetical protein